MTMLEKFKKEIQRRGGEIRISDKRSSVSVEITNRAHRLYLLRAEGWRYYSRREKPRFVSIAYLCGKDDSGLWAHRVPGTIKTVKDALDYMIPADVKKSLSKKLPVIRQGDVYFIPAMKDDFSKLPRGHYVDQFHTARHTTHQPIRIPFLARTCQQNFIPMGRNGTTSGD